MHTHLRLRSLTERQQPQSRRFYVEDLAAIAACILKPLPAFERNRIASDVLLTLAQWGLDNLSSWLAAHGLEIADAMDLIPTRHVIASRMEQMPVDRQRAHSTLCELAASLDRLDSPAFRELFLGIQREAA